MTFYNSDNETSSKSINIGETINRMIEARSEGNPAIAEMTKAKLILKGIYPDRYRNASIDDQPDIFEKLIEINKQWNAESPKVGDNVFQSAFSQMSTEEEVVLDIQNQLECMGIKVLIYFSSASFDQDKLSHLMEKAFSGSVVFGCSTAGERINENLLTGSVVALALCPNLIADAKVELLNNLSRDVDIKPAFKSFNNYFHESTYNMDTSKYVGIVLMDGLSLKEERIMDGIGNLTNVSFVGASAGDDFKFDNTYVYTDGRAYTDAAIIALLKMQDDAKFSILKTQSFNTLEPKLVANKVNIDAREVIEFNNKPAAQAYSEAIGCSVKELPNLFLNHPVGLQIDRDNILVRSPQRTDGSSIFFFCNILEGMEVTLLESGDIINETKNVLDRKIQASEEKTVGILSFDCIYRRIELENNNLMNEYGKIFKDTPTVGFYSYGEAYIGHMNQTATMLVFEYGLKHTDLEKIKLSNSDIESDRMTMDDHDLEAENRELRKKLDLATAELKKFNKSLAEEINSRTEREEKIRSLSYKDELTGVYNRRFYAENINKLDTKANLPLSVIYGDVDGLKKVNDAIGHSMGDDLLQKAAAAIKNSCRKSDIIVRLGGDEFLVLLPKTSRKRAVKIVKRISKNASSQYVNNTPISISFGLDTKVSNEKDISQTVKNAEQLMYQHKNKPN